LSNLGRREFLLGAGLTGAGLLAFYGLSRHSGFSGSLWTASSDSASSLLGPLLPAKTTNTGETFLALPKDFQYTVIGKTGSRMSDGKLTPSDHDGMAAFFVNGELRLVRNHEVPTKIGTSGAAVGPNAFDPLAASGTTTLVIDPKTRWCGISLV
jgi:secreted PhoX family phosphatase